MTFDFFAWWGEDRNDIVDEIKTDLRLLLTQQVGWLEFNRDVGNIIGEIEMQPNSSVLQAIVKANLSGSIYNYNNMVSDDRQVTVSQDYIKFDQVDDKLVIDLTFYITKTLKREQLLVNVG